MSVQGITKEEAGIKDKVNEPHMYRVIMHNDDFTTMEFVVSVLIDIFRKSPKDAESLMMAVHKKGSAVIGRYPYDIAVTKTNTAMERAKEEGFPFRMTLEED